MVMVAVSLGIITSSFLIPVVVVPAIFEVSKASDCAVSAGCAEDTFSRCGAYQSSEEADSFGEAMKRGFEGMLCMIGLGDTPAELVIWASLGDEAATLNKM
jgi:hypothetical protein